MLPSKTSVLRRPHARPQSLRIGGRHVQTATTWPVSHTQHNQGRPSPPAVFTSGQEFLLGLLIPDRRTKRDNNGHLDEDSDSTDDDEARDIEASAPLPLPSRPPIKALLYNQEDIEDVSLTLSLEPFSDPTDTVKLQNGDAVKAVKGNSARHGVSAADLNSPAAVLQGDGGNGNSNGNGKALGGTAGGSAVAVAVDLSRIQPAPTVPRRGTPTAARGTPGASRTSSPGPRRSPEPASSTPSRPSHARAGARASETVAPVATRAVGQTLDSMDSVLAEKQPTQATAASGTGNSNGSGQNGMIQTAAKVLQILKGEGKVPANERPLTPLPSVEEAAPLRKVPSLEEVAPVKPLAAVEERAPVNVLTGKACATPQLSTVTKDANVVVAPAAKAASSGRSAVTAVALETKVSEKLPAAGVQAPSKGGEGSSPPPASRRTAPAPSRRASVEPEDSMSAPASRRSSSASPQKASPSPPKPNPTAAVAASDKAAAARPPETKAAPDKDKEERKEKTLAVDLETNPLPPAPTRSRTPAAAMAAAAAAGLAAAANSVAAAVARVASPRPKQASLPPSSAPARSPSPPPRTASPTHSRRVASPIPGVSRLQLYKADQLIPGEDYGVYDFPDGPRWSLLSRKPLAGGTLDIVRWCYRRMLRIWLPPGYDKASAQLAGGLPWVLMHDAQNLFDPELSASKTTWKAAETAAHLITTGRLPPFVIVGADHPGLARPYEYTPYTPGTGPGGFRADAASWPGGGVWQYLERLVEELLPWATQTYILSERPSERIMAGSSFGGIATLCAALKYPQVWGGSIVESPSLWIAEEKLLRDVKEHSGALPPRMFIGMGGREFSGVRPESAAKAFPMADATVAGYATTLADTLVTKGLVMGKGVLVEVQEKATHNEVAWADRLPRALTFLASHWWARALEGKQGRLYTTVPLRLRPNCPGLLLVNRERSESLARCASLRLHAGYNMGWEIKQPDMDFKPVEWKSSDLEPVTDKDGKKSDSGAMAAADWWACSFQVPADAYEMHFALSGTQDKDGQGERLWDNNAGANFFLSLAPPLPLANYSAVESQRLSSKDAEGSARDAVVAKATQALQADPQPMAHKNSSKTYFTVPDQLYAGAPAMIYFNKKRSWGFADQPNVKLHYGWNGWDDKMLPGGSARVDFKPTSLWRDEHTDWWGGYLIVPEDAVEMNFAFTDGADVWDANGGFNYSMPVMSNTMPVGSVARPRAVASVQALPHGAGTMHILDLAKRDKSDPGWSKQGRWTDEKLVRVWTPPGWSADKAPPGGWPVLYLSDGQNKFEDQLAHQGVAWRVGYQSSDLVSNGTLPPYIVVGIDSAGAMRSLNYLPYAPGTGAGGFRGDAERWPGGGVSSYMKRVTEEIMPLVQQRFGAASDPELVTFGGGSFGGVCALYAAMHYPHLFGGILAESPSLWIAEGRFLADLAAHKGQLPARIFLGCGTREYSATRDHQRPDVDALLLHYCSEAARILDEKGCRAGQGRLRFHVEEGAGHHESAWAWRFSGAIGFLHSHLWEYTPKKK